MVLREAFSMADKRIYFLLEDIINCYAIKNDVIYSRFILVDASTDFEHIKKSIVHSVELGKKVNYLPINPYEDKLLMEETLSDSYFMCLKRKYIYGATFANYYVFYKFIEVPEDFKETFNKYYDEYSLMKVNPYTEPNLYQELAYTASKATGIEQW